MEYSTLNLSKWYNCRIRIPSDKIITFNILASCEHRLLPFSLFTKYLVHFWRGEESEGGSKSFKWLANFLIREIVKGLW